VSEKNECDWRSASYDVMRRILFTIVQMSECGEECGKEESISISAKYFVKAHQAI
jgi:hypothetical protein